VSNWKVICPHGHETEFVSAFDYASSTSYGEDGDMITITFRCATCGSEIQHDNYFGETEERTK
jgi:hypothetical protein